MQLLVSQLIYSDYYLNQILMCVVENTLCHVPWFVQCAVRIDGVHHLSCLSVQWWHDSSWIGCSSIASLYFLVNKDPTRGLASTPSHFALHYSATHRSEGSRFNSHCAAARAYLHIIFSVTWKTYSVYPFLPLIFGTSWSIEQQLRWPRERKNLSILVPTTLQTTAFMLTFSTSCRWYQKGCVEASCIRRLSWRRVTHRNRERELTL